VESLIRIGLSSCTAIVLFCASNAEADNNYIDQRVKVSFPPFSAFLFCSSDLQQVESNAAVVIPRDGATQEYVVGARIPELSGADVLVSFFLRGRDASFAATPVRRVTSTELQSAEKGEFEVEALTTEQERQATEKDIMSLSYKLRELRALAMKSAGVDDLVQIQTELNRYQSAGVQRQNEGERLKELLAIGRKESESLNLDPLRQKLSEDLRDTAQVTALADRLKTRKKQTAKEGFQEKLSLVKEMSRYSREDLAKEILALRAKRKELEILKQR